MLTHECHWNRQHFMRWKIAHPWWGSNPRSLCYIPNSINSHHVSDHQSNASQIYFYISGAPNQAIIYENDKIYELKMSNNGHFEFSIYGETVSLPPWHTAKMDSAWKIHIEQETKYFFSKMSTGLYLGLYFNFLSWLKVIYWIVFTVDR